MAHAEDDEGEEIERGPFGDRMCSGDLWRREFDANHDSIDYGTPGRNDSGLNSRITQDGKCTSR
jgi:hypothetical protein